MMDIAVQVIGLLGKYSEGFAIAFALLTLLVYVFFKKEDKDINKVAKINELQNENLSTLIEQNTELFKQLTVVRDDLRKAFIVINDMRLQIIELEDIIKTQRIDGPLVIRK